MPPPAPVTSLPYSERRALLEQLDVEAPRVRLVATFEDGQALFAAVCERGLERVADVQRKRLLDERIHENIVRGGRRGPRIESHGEFDAVLVKGHRPNHVLHLVITIALLFVSVVTLGAGLVLVAGWIVVWILLTLLEGERRALVTVDEYGHVETSPLRASDRLVSRRSLHR